MYKNLLDRFETPGRVFQASKQALMAVDGVSDRLADDILSGPPAAAVSRELSRIQKSGCRVITFSDEEYPPLLKETPDPPPYLYVKGQMGSCTQCIAMVGSRKATRYGISMAGKLSADLAEAGFTVVSGMARGIDTAAHEGALSVQGETIAVLGSGLSVIYPRENRQLAARISESGAVISEFPLEEAPNAYNFPKRNRIIAGMSLGTVVVEAASRSGSLITARLSGEQGREVFAVPGNINSKTSTGAHNLLKQGAKLVETAQDIIEEFPFLFLKSDMNRGNDHTVKPVQNLTGEESRVYELLEPYPVHIDELSRRLEMDAGRLSGILMALEIKGLVSQTPGKYFATV
ncbi:MAG: DNA-processing protein DprA [Desulfobacterales bacterium]